MTDRKTFGESVVQLVSTYVDIERAMEPVKADHTEPRSLWKWRRSLQEQLDKAMSRFVIEGYDLVLAAEAAENLAREARERTATDGGATR